jgi:Variant SH3 domain
VGEGLKSPDAGRFQPAADDAVDVRQEPAGVAVVSAYRGGRPTPLALQRVRGEGFPLSRRLGGDPLPGRDRTNVIAPHSRKRQCPRTRYGTPAVVRTGYDTTELPTHVGEVLDVVAEDLVSGWVWCRSREGREGWVPLKTFDVRA